jgi:hypothetical protein
MATVARAEIEALLRARKLDTTLTSTRPVETSGGPAAPGDAADEQYVVATGIAALDDRLGGGLARGQMSEIVGPRSSGRTAVVLSALAGAASRGELVALVDTFDTFDPSSARACGLDLTRLLWVRGRRSDTRVEGRTSDDAHVQSIDRALKAFNLILQAGGFGLVVLDLADALPWAIRRLPFTTWFRLQRPIEGSATACVLLASEPVARSAGGVTIALRRVTAADGRPLPSAHCGGLAQAPRDVVHSTGWTSLFLGFEVEARLARARGAAEACTFECRATPACLP